MKSVAFGTAASALALAFASPANALPADLKAKADALLAASYPADGPGASVVISEHGRIVYQGTRGLADVAAKKPITPATVFRIGSITKQFSSAVVLQLAAEGKLKLSDPISAYLPTYPNGSAITVAELLNHTSGIQSYTSIPGWMVEANTARAYTTEQLMAVFKDLPAPTKPGAHWDYNNSGYILVGALIEAVTKHPWHEEVDRRIVKPLGLKSFRYGVEEPGIAQMAKGYSQDEGKIVPARAIHMSVPGAAGALDGTPADLARWADALHHGKVVPAPYYAQMIAPTKLPDGSTHPYGFGIAPGKLRGLEEVGHSGGIFGFSTDSMYVPASDVFVAVFANSDSPKTPPATVTRKLAALAVGKPYPVFTEQPLDPAALKPFLGTYKLKDKERVLTIEDGKLLYVRPEGEASELVPVGDGRYSFGLDSVGWIELKRDAAGKPLMSVLPDGEDEDGPAPLIGPVPPPVKAFDVPAATLKRYVGSYTSPMGKVTIAEAGEGKLTAQLAGQPAIPLRATGLADFDVERVGAKLHVVEEGGKIVRIEIVQRGRTLPATRD